MASYIPLGEKCLTNLCDKNKKNQSATHDWLTGWLVYWLTDWLINWIITYGAKLLNADWLRQRAFFLLITRALLVIKRAWLLDADWLNMPALSRFPASSRFWKNSETRRFWVPGVWSKHGCFILTWKRINMQRSAVFSWKSKRIFPAKNVLIWSLKKVWVGTAGVARYIDLQNFMAAKLKVSFFVLLWVALLVLQATLSA